LTIGPALVTPGFLGSCSGIRIWSLGCSGGGTLQTTCRPFGGTALGVKVGIGRSRTSTNGPGWNELVSGCVDDVLFKAASNVQQTLSQFVRAFGMQTF